MLLASEEVVNASNEQHAAEHDDAPVHVSDSRRIDDGEEAGDASHGDVEDGEGVDRDGKFAEGEAGGWERFAADALLENAGKGCQWGAVEDGIVRDGRTRRLRGRKRRRWRR